MTPPPGFIYPPQDLLPDGSLASSVRQFDQARVGDDGWIYLFDEFGNYRFRPNLAEEVTQIAADDGSEIYEFTPSGKHVRTTDALTGAVRYTFSYDPEGRLTAITDGDGLTTQITRDGSGAPDAIVAPFGQTTTLEVDGEGWLFRSLRRAIARRRNSTASGLLTNLEDPNGNPHVHMTLQAPDPRCGTGRRILKRSPAPFYPTVHGRRR